MTTTCYGTKPYDHEYFSRAKGVGGQTFQFHELPFAEQTPAWRKARMQYECL